MGIVRFALRWPYTFYVLALLILFLGVTAFRSMPTDIFPEIDIPVVTVIWQYTGLSTPEMEQRVTTYSEYAMSTAVSGIKDIEAQTLDGISVQKIYFQPDVSIDLAIAQIINATNYIRLLMPPGIQSPLVVEYNASSVPVLQISLSSDTLSEQQLYDYGLYNLRQRLAPIHGVTFPTPAGGKYRQIMVDLDPAKLLAKGLTPLDVANAVNAQNLTLPSGTAKIGDTQYTVRTNAVPATIDDLNNIPVKYANGATVFVKDLCPRRVASAAERRSIGWAAFGPAERHKERQRLNRRCRQGGQKGAQGRPRLGPARHGDQGAVRPVGVRQRLGGLGVARGGHRGRTDCTDDPFVPRLLALDPGGHDLDPAIGSVIAGRALFPRRYAQHDDIGRIGARHRHPGR
jgi:hypothetical protein